MVRAKWWGEGLREQYGVRLDELNRYPEDVGWAMIGNPVNPPNMTLSWDWQSEGLAKDAGVIIDDWGKLDEFIEKLPSPEGDPDFERLVQNVAEIRKQGMYVLTGWWNFFFERPWQLRGMQNLLCDFHIAQDEIHRLYSAMCDTYCSYLQRAAEVAGPDGFFTSDDLGHQTGPMMSPEIFREIIYPYYKRVGDVCAENNMHFWLHSCGDNSPLMDDLIDAGLTVFHPVQKGTMDEKAIAAEFGDRLSFFAGIDVQHTLQEKDAEGVREEVRFLIDTFDRPDGGMCMSAGNGIVSGTPYENIEAFLDETLSYGASHRGNRPPAKR